MRREFFVELYNHMKTNPLIWALTGDLGYGGFDRIKQDFPDRFVNCGASEQAMLDVAVGLAYSGKIPVVYSITPFLLYRGFETLRTYINHEKLNVKLVGSGRGDDYKHDGYSHYAGDDYILFTKNDGGWPDVMLDSIEYLNPFTVTHMVYDVRYMLSKFKPHKPHYLNLKR